MSNDEVSGSAVISEESARLKPRKAPPWTFEFVGMEENREVPRTFIQRRPAKTNSSRTQRKP